MLSPRKRKYAKSQVTLHSELQDSTEYNKKQQQHTVLQDVYKSRLRVSKSSVEQKPLISSHLQCEGIHPLSLEILQHHLHTVFKNTQNDSSLQMKTLRKITIFTFKNTQNNSSLQMKTLRKITIFTFENTQNNSSPQMKTLRKITIFTFKNTQNISSLQIKTLKKSA